jgi:predicted RNase H-like HicB family nuclease
MILYFAKLHAEADGGYSVEIVDLPGCFTEGDDLTDALRNAEEAILCHLDGMIADGEPIPAPVPRGVTAVEPGAFLVGVQIDLDQLEISNKTVRLSVTIPQRALALIDRAAKLSDTSRSGFLTQAALTYINQRTEKNA